MMQTNLYYPPLKRQDLSAYYKSEGVFFSTYNCQTNYNNVAQDCQFRCVYCDVHIDECGGEPFSLDHFRPQDIFGNKFNGILRIHPFNLHLSCQKCNVLKTNDWKGCKVTMDGPTFLSGQGYIDRFEADASKYLEVDTTGQVNSTDPNGPANYMIKKLLLNRTNRVYIRKLREVKLKSQKVLNLIKCRQEKVMNDWNNSLLTEQQAKKEIEKLTKLIARYTALSSTTIAKLVD